MMTVKEFLNSSGLTASFKGLWIILDEHFRVFEKEAMFTGVKEVFVNLNLRMTLMFSSLAFSHRREEVTEPPEGLTHVPGRAQGGRCPHWSLVSLLE